MTKCYICGADATRNCQGYGRSRGCGRFICEAHAQDGRAECPACALERRQMNSLGCLLAAILLPLVGLALFLAAQSAPPGGTKYAPTKIDPYGQQGPAPNVSPEGPYNYSPVPAGGAQGSPPARP